MFNWLQITIDWLVYDVFKLVKGSEIGNAINFFFFDTIKIFILLMVIIYVITFIRGFFSPEKTRMLLAKNKGRTFVGHIVAALFGIVTPFCSCSAVPLFIGFVEAGVPLGVTFSFLISAPMINEVAIGLLYGLFGWKVSLIYIASGIIIALVSGIIIGKLKLEKYVEGYVYKIQMREQQIQANISFKDRFSDAFIFTKNLIKKIWIYVIIGVGIGAAIHGWVPAGALAQYAGKDNPFAVLIAVIIGIPLYSNAAGVLPLVSELTVAGVSMGTALAFMMAVTALSLPEAILLRKVMKPQLLFIFFGVVGAGIVLTGYLFNLFLA